METGLLVYYNSVLGILVFLLILFVVLTIKFFKKNLGEGSIYACFLRLGDIRCGCLGGFRVGNCRPCHWCYDAYKSIRAFCDAAGDFK